MSDDLESLLSLIEKAKKRGFEVRCTALREAPIGLHDAHRRVGVFETPAEAASFLEGVSYVQTKT